MYSSRFFSAIFFLLVLMMVSPAFVYAKTTASAETIYQSATFLLPQVLDDETVYASRYVTVFPDPLLSVAWDVIEFPSAWAERGWYVEVWDHGNHIVPGFGAQKLLRHELDISSIDSTMYPKIRVILFQPPGTPVPNSRGPVVFAYLSRVNTRLFLFAALIMALFLAVAVSFKKYHFGFREILTHTRWIFASRPLPPFFSSVAKSAAAIIFWSGIFGITIGLYTGGIHVLYVFLKLPFLFLCSFLVSFSSLLVLAWIFGWKAKVGEILSESLSYLVITSVVLATLSPVMIFYIAFPKDHDFLLIASLWFFVMAYGIGALRLYRQLRFHEVKHPFIATILWMTLYGFVLIQLGWLLRPWIGILDPVFGSIPFSRLYSGNVFLEIIAALGRLR